VVVVAGKQEQDTLLAVAGIGTPFVPGGPEVQDMALQNDRDTTWTDGSPR
jgi:hypothetical protein